MGYQEGRAPTGGKKRWFAFHAMLPPQHVFDLPPNPNELKISLRILPSTENPNPTTSIKLGEKIIFDVSNHIVSVSQEERYQVDNEITQALIAMATHPSNICTVDKFVRLLPTKHTYRQAERKLNTIFSALQTTIPVFGNTITKTGNSGYKFQEEIRP